MITMWPLAFMRQKKARASSACGLACTHYPMPASVQRVCACPWCRAGERTCTVPAGYDWRGQGHEHARAHTRGGKRERGGSHA